MVGAVLVDRILGMVDMDRVVAADSLLVVAGSVEVAGFAGLAVAGAVAWADMGRDNTSFFS